MLLGLEYYQKPPFKIIPDIVPPIEGNHDHDTLMKYVYEEPPIERAHAKELYEKYQDNIDFVLGYSNYLVSRDRIEESIGFLKDRMVDFPEDRDLRIKLAMDYYMSERDDEFEDLILEIKDKYMKPGSEVEITHFQHFCNLLADYYKLKYDKDKLLEIFSWTLNEETEDLCKSIAIRAAGAMLAPMPNKPADFHEEIIEKEETYFHFVEVNDAPYHAPFQDYQDRFLDEISLQELRAIEQLDNQEEIIHDIKWLIKNDIVNIGRGTAVFQPAGAKMAMMLASIKNASEALPDLFALTRLPQFYKQFGVFQDYFEPFILNPFYHIGKLDPRPLIEFVQNREFDGEARFGITNVLKVIHSDFPQHEKAIEDGLAGTEYETYPLPAKIEIVENKITKLIEHFNNIPIEYFEDDEDYSDETSESSEDESSVIEYNGGWIGKPTSLESALFTNYMMVQMDMQKAEEAFMPPPEESIAPLQPMIKPTKIGRNDPCPCGSGKKYKKCCLNNLN